MTEVADITRRVELEINAAIRRALEAGASKVEGLDGNPHYKAAFKLAARTLRGMKPD